VVEDEESIRERNSRDHGRVCRWRAGQTAESLLCMVGFSLAEAMKPLLANKP